MLLQYLLHLCSVDSPPFLSQTSSPGISLLVGHLQLDFYVFPQTEHVQNQSHQLSLKIFSKLNLSVNNYSSYLFLQTQHLSSLQPLHSCASMQLVRVKSILHLSPSRTFNPSHTFTSFKTWPLDQKLHKGRGCYFCVHGCIPDPEDCTWGTRKCFLSDLQAPQISVCYCSLKNSLAWYSRCSRI